VVPADQLVDLRFSMDITLSLHSVLVLIRIVLVLIWIAVLVLIWITGH